MKNKFYTVSYHKKYLFVKTTTEIPVVDTLLQSKVKTLSETIHKIEDVSFNEMISMVNDDNYQVLNILQYNDSPEKREITKKLLLSMLEEDYTSINSNSFKKIRLDMQGEDITITIKQLT